MFWKNKIIKAMSVVTAGLIAIAPALSLKSYAAESADGKVSVVATAINKNMEAQQGIEFSLYKIADSADGDYGYKVSLSASETGIDAADLAGKMDSSEIAKILDSAYSLWKTPADQTATTGSNGEAVFSGLKTGVYLVRNTTSDETYQKLGHTYSVDSFLVEVTQINKDVICKPKGTVRDIQSDNGGDGGVGAVAIIKCDEDTGAYLSGAKFTLYKSSGEKVSSVTTDEKGWAEVRYLAYGDYYFVEDEAPEGYKKSSDKISFTLDVEHSYSSDYPWNIKVTNKKDSKLSALNQTSGESGTTASGDTNSADAGTTVGGLISSGDYSNAALLCIVGGVLVFAAGGLLYRRKKN